MKDATQPARHSIFHDLWDALNPPRRSEKKSNPSANLPERAERREFVYYQPVIDYETQQIAGHLTDISAGGFKLDTRTPVAVGREFRFVIKLSMEVADKPAMAFVARSRWCKVDPLDPYIYNVGFQLVQIAPADLKIFQRMMELYGRERSNGNINLQRSSK